MSSVTTKILCLHGYLQTKQRFIEKSGAFRKNMRKWNVEMSAINAPFLTTVPESLRGNYQVTGSNRGMEIVGECEYRSWLQSLNEDFTKYTGWTHSVQYVMEYMKNEGPFDGLLGFSQGCIIVQLIAAMTRWESIVPAVKISDVQKLKPLSELYESLRDKSLLPVAGLKFAILVGGFLPNDETLKSIFKSIEIPDFPSLHIIGESDKIIVPERSEELVNLFKAENSNGQIVRAKHIHKGQHVIPHDKQTIDAVKDFINKLKV